MTRNSRSFLPTKLWLPCAGLLCVASFVAVSANPGDKAAFKVRPMAEITAFLAQKDVHKEFLPKAPLGFTEDQVKKGIPANNPLTKAKVELGRQLYFDPRLSKDCTVSCASCHHPKFGYGDGEVTSKGIKGQRGGRNAPTVINRLFSGIQFWDGRAKDLEEQALGPIANPIEMGNTHEEAIKFLSGVEGYKVQFKAVFGSDTITKDHIAKAIAAFERTVVSGDSVYDVHDQAKPYLDLDEEDMADLEPELQAKAKAMLKAVKERPMSDSAKRGQKLFFNKAQCSLCHAGANFTDELYWNLGVGMSAKNPDMGRFVVTKEEKDKGAFKTPTLRNVAETAPYMHDGSQKTLEEVIDFYNQGGEKNPWLSSRVKKLNLSDQEKKDLVEFLKSLNGKVTPVDMPSLPK